MSTNSPPPPNEKPAVLHTKAELEARQSVLKALDSQIEALPFKLSGSEKRHVISFYFNKMFFFFLRLINQKIVFF